MRQLDSIVGFKFNQRPYIAEDYIWEMEYECPHRAACIARSPDTHLPVRPNETYFRYTTPNLARRRSSTPD
jgi:hypothetical protein